MRVALAALALAACGGGGVAAPPDATPCPVAPSADGPLGAHVAIVSMSPDPPARFLNDWVVTATTAAGAPATAADVTVQPFMPAHGHGASTLPTLSDLAGGAIDIAGIDLWMPGTWEVRITVAGDRAVFTVCIAE